MDTINKNVKQANDRGKALNRLLSNKYNILDEMLWYDNTTWKTKFTRWNFELNFMNLNQISYDIVENWLEFHRLLNEIA